MINEHYNSQEYNSFLEHKPFKAEQYAASLEVSSPAQEHSPKGHEYKPSQKQEKKAVASQNPIKRLLQRLTGSATTVATTVVTTVVAAASSVAIILGITAPTPEIEVLELNAGNDYVSYSVELDSLEKEKSYSLVVENPYHSFEYDVKGEGAHTQLVTGLKPGLAYDLSLVAKDGEGDMTSYEGARFYTTNSDTPTAVFNVSLLPSGGAGGAKIDYSVYISDTFGVGKGYVLEMEADGKKSELNNKTEGGFFKGSVYDPPAGQIALRVLANIKGKGETVVGEYKLNNTLSSISKPIKLDAEINSLKLTGVNTATLVYTVNKPLVISDEWEERLLVNVYLDGVKQEGLSGYYGVPDDVGVANSVALNLPYGYSRLDIELKLCKVALSGEVKEEQAVASRSITLPTVDDLKHVVSVDLEGGMSRIDLLGMLPDNGFLVLTNKTSGEEIKTLLYDEYYGKTISSVSWQNGAGEAEYSFYIMDEGLNKIYQSEPFTVDYSTPVPEYSFSYRNPGDAVITKNEDGTINIYLNLQFSSSDENVYCAVLLDETEFITKAPIFVAEDITFKSYSLKYIVFKEINGIRYELKTVYPSGTIDADVWIDFKTNYENGLLEVMLDNKAINDGKDGVLKLSNGKEIKIVETDFEYREGLYYAYYEVGETVESVTLCAKFVLSGSLDRDVIFENTDVKGSEYFYFEFTAVPNGG